MATADLLPQQLSCGSLPLLVTLLFFANYAVLPQHWLVDPEAAAVVKHIFDLCMEGRGPSQIANLLRADKVMPPGAYQRSCGRNKPTPPPENPYDWHSSTIVAILERREYTEAVR